MKVTSGDCIEVKTGALKSVRGFALVDFESDDADTDFTVRLIGKKDAIGEIVTYNTGKNNVKAVTDDKYSKEPTNFEEEKS